MIHYEIIMDQTTIENSKIIVNCADVTQWLPAKVLMHYGCSGGMGMIRFVTFNICGIKGILSRCAQWVPDKTFNCMFNALEGDVICLQETKIQSTDISRDMAIVPEFNAFFTCSTGRKGYSGVVIYVRNTIRVFHAEEGLSGWLGYNGKAYRETPYFPASIYPETLTAKEGRMLDEQGRVLTIDLGACVVIGVYCPANSQGNMQEYRDQFFDLLDWRVHQLQKHGREVVVMGDLNVAREPQDSAPLREELVKQKLPIDREEWMYGSVARAAVNNWIKSGFQDTSRLFHPLRTDMFTCWDQSKSCRPANFGSRIDYVLASENLECVGADILPELVGSDHCPVYAEFNLPGIEPQRGNALPALGRILKNRWPRQIHQFFKPQGAKQALNNAEAETEAEQHTVEGQQTFAVQMADKPAAEQSTTEYRKSIAENHTGELSIENHPIPKNTEELPVEYTTKLHRTANQALKQTMNTHKGRVTKTTNLPGTQQTSITDMLSIKPLNVPNCQHGIPCVLKRSSKPPRKGEYFWVCSRPNGGKLNNSGEFQCKTFIWTADLHS